MKTGLGLVAAVALILLASGAVAEEVAGLPLHIQKLDPGVIRVWVGDHISSTATVAIATDKGILVIDTTGNPRVDGELRRIIARELGRNDFKILINTHEHGDHTGGNSVYADCTIVGHELVGAGMAAQAGNQARAMEWNTARIAELQRDLEKEPADSPAVARMREELVLSRLNLEARQASVKVCPPTKTFADRMTLKLGGTAFELYYIGGMHSPDDIAVFVPKHGLLMTGDTMADVWLTETPGCLASFMARPGIRHDFPLLIENWDLLLAKKDAIRKFVPGHWNGELSYAGFEARVNYVKTLWTGVNRGADEDRSLADLQMEYRLDTRFPELVSSPGFIQGNNYLSILGIWSAVTKQESAADRLYTLIDQGADDSAIRQVLDGRDAKPARYFFQEPELNASGYRFFQADRLPQAIAMFRLNVELFPGSWNVYDSLGEALLKAGNTDTATRMYEESLRLNPESQSGKDALARIREPASTK